MAFGLWYLGIGYCYLIAITVQFLSIFCKKDLKRSAEQASRSIACCRSRYTSIFQGRILSYLFSSSPLCRRYALVLRMATAFLTSLTALWCDNISSIFTFNLAFLIYKLIGKLYWKIRLAKVWPTFLNNVSWLALNACVKISTMQGSSNQPSCCTGLRKASFRLGCTPSGKRVCPRNQRPCNTVFRRFPCWKSR